MYSWKRGTGSFWESSLKSLRLLDTRARKFSVRLLHIWKIQTVQNISCISQEAQTHNLSLQHCIKGIKNFSLSYKNLYLQNLEDGLHLKSVRVSRRESTQSTYKLRKAFYLHDQYRRKNIRLVLWYCKYQCKILPFENLWFQRQKCFTLSHMRMIRELHIFTPYNKYFSPFLY